MVWFCSWHSLLFVLFTSQLNLSLSSSKHMCNSDESSALLQFKNSFFVNHSQNNGFLPSSFSPNTTDSWAKDEDCCTWSGVTCERVTGHVSGLNLSAGGLQGILHSNSSLFSLGHLKMLDLSCNNFMGSSISSKFGGFVSMTHLLLDFSNFTGQIPPGISHLSKLVSLQLSSGLLFSDLYERTTIDTLIMRRIAQNLTSLRVLSLDIVDMSLVEPDSFLNLSSSLTSLSLFDCNLRGKFPVTIFHLPNLQELDLRHNSNLTGYIPKSNWTSPLNDLRLSVTKISIDLHFLTSSLKSLGLLLLQQCSFTRSHLELSGNLTQLMVLSLSGNSFGGQIPWSLLNFEQLIALDLSSNMFVGELPEIHGNFTNASSYVPDPSEEQLVGSIPLGLSLLGLHDNLLGGTIPSWVYSLPSLNYLTLSHNEFTGNINDFHSPSLWNLDLSNNKLHGMIPSSIYGLVQLRYLDISSNNLSGALPSTICNLNSVKVIDLSNNSLSGRIPECIGNLSPNISVLDLHMNQFRGEVPSTFPKGNLLRNLNLHGNQMEGTLPQSLLNCRILEVLDLGNNKINDTFPNWLESLPELQVLILRSNRLYGPIGDPETKFPFQKLRIIDLSFNQFGGPLPAKYFQKLVAMKNVRDDELKYMGESYYEDTITVIMKGFELELVKIQTMFTTIDFSGNDFRGEIPGVIGELKSLKGLNFSSNKLQGPIPSVFGNLTNLEWLDVSSNMLSGEIPRQLAGLTSLAKLNFSENQSENQLVGPIPRGNQFDTYENDSYSGNLGLCGYPLSKTCINEKEPEPPSFDQQEDDMNGFDWKMVWMGYGCGMVIGFSVGYIVFSIRKVDWRIRVMGRELRSKMVKRAKKTSVRTRN